MSNSIKSIVNQDVRDKVVIVRADLNIPITNGVIQDYSRVKRLVPTIDYLVKSGSKVVICSHLGRPNGEFNKELSLKPLVEVLSEIIKTKVHFSSSCIGDEALGLKKHLKSKEILLLENLRFNKNETKNDFDFSKELSRSCYIYVNYSFSCSNRSYLSFL